MTDAHQNKGAYPTNAFIPFEKAQVEQSIPDRFEQQVRQHAARLAIKAPDGTFTYAELNRLANRIAHAILTRRGEGQETIALLFEQGAFIIAATAL